MYWLRCFTASFIIVFEIAVLSSVATADQAITSLSLSEAVDLALNNNSLIKEAAEKTNSAIQEKNSSRADFFPKVSAGWSYTSMKDSPFSNFMDQTFNVSHDTLYHWDITVTQALSHLYPLWNRFKIMDIGVDIKNLEQDLTALEIVKNVKTAYFNLLLTKKLSIVTKEVVNNLRSHLNNAEKFSQEGMIPYNDLLKAEVALSDAIQRYEKAQADAVNATAGLNILLELDINNNTIVDDITVVPSSGFTLSELFDISLNNRPELKLLNLATEQVTRGITIAKFRYYPQVALVGRYERNGDDFRATNNDYGNHHNSMMVIQADWQIFEWGKTRADVSKLHSDKRSLLEKIKGLKNSILLETKSAYLNLNVSEKNIKTAQESLGQARENWRITSVQYNQHISTSTDVLDARTFLTQAETNYYIALYGYMISLAELERAVGKTL